MRMRMAVRATSVRRATWHASDLPRPPRGKSTCGNQLRDPSGKEYGAWSIPGRNSCNLFQWDEAGRCQGRFFPKR